MKIPFSPSRLFALALLAAACPALAAGPVGTPIIAPAFKALTYVGPGDPASVVKVVPVTGQDFQEALQVNTFGLGKPDTRDYGLFARLTSPVKKGDVIWLSFKARALESKRESGEAFFELRFDQLVDGKYKWPAYIERGISVGKEWTEVSIPYRMERDITPETARLAMSFDHYPQRFELSPVIFINCGPAVQVADLPRSVVRYGGSEPDAAWRAAAAARIEKFRKGDLALKILDKDGRPVADAQVAVHMKRLDFIIGTAIDARLILSDSDPDAQKYREVLARYFNNMVFDNDMKWPRWANPAHDPAPLLRVLDWADAHGLTARGHCMVWPSWGHLPAYLKDLKNDPEALRREIFKNIALQTGVMKGRFIQWDVTNELFNHHDLVDILGRDEIVAWYRAAHAGDPDVKLFYNDYTMFFPEGPGTGNFYDNVRFLKEKGAPIGGLGEQAHVAGSPPAIPLVIDRLAHFSDLGLPIMITEFDMSSNDEDFQARYIRDFMTAVFSSPGTVGFVQWGFWAGAHWMPNAALWNKDWSIRKHGQVFADIVTKEWRTDATGPTAPDGTYDTRAFYGDYEVKITRDGKTRTFPLKHAPDETAQTLTFAD